jgi:uncharacterized protein (TIGR03083 family)
MADLMPMIHAERAALADYLQGLTADQWRAPTWCTAWNVQEVTGHLIAAARITAPHFFAAFVSSGFSFDRTVGKDLRQYAQGSPGEVLERFRGIITSTRKPPGPAYVALGEIMVHGEDIRRALGDVGDHKAEHAVTLADLYVTTGPPLRGKKRAAGLALRATDADWRTGSGPEVSGPIMSLILAVVGRPGVLADLEGPGLATLRGRVSAA